MLCKCGHYYERVQPYLTLSVEIKHKKNLAEGLAAFIQGEMLEGDNAYHCAKCDKKVDTEKRCLVKELPRFMIISLKRFELDMEKFVKVKLNDQCEFPLDLDMLPYT
jgi:ubiquitin carboxyl-terminal hydrolase 9/24